MDVRTAPSAPRARVTWISYFPVDGSPFPDGWHAWLKNADIPIVTSRWGAGVVEKATGINPIVLYHGVHTGVYRPVDKAAAKGRVGLEPDRFVVGYVGTNQQRKNLPALINGFAKFSRQCAEAILYLHTDDGYWRLAELAESLGIKEKLRTTPGLNTTTNGVPESQLVDIYNSFDIMCLPTMGEGFGLPIIEGQSCGVPVLVTGCSACTELVASRGQLLRVKANLVMMRNISQAVVDELHIAGRIKGLYSDRRRLSSLSVKCRRFAESFDWAILSRELVGLVDRLPRRKPTVKLMFSEI